MTDRRLPSAAVVVLASVIAAAGMVAHNALEFGPAFLLDPETLIPLAIFGLFALLAWAGPANAGVHSALLAWALLNLVGGGILSVLPLGLFPFEPEQSPAHYGAHVIYAAAQLPLVVVATRAVRRGRPQTGVEDAR
jgi:peptidoglycan/LPS O-acetylase OafA/YrhL